MTIGHVLCTLDNLEISQDTSVILGADFNLFSNRLTQTVGIRQLKLNLCPNCRKLWQKIICAIFLEYVTLRNDVSHGKKNPF